MLKEWILSKTNIVKYEIYKKISKFPEIRRNILKLKFQGKEIKYISDETRIVVYIISTATVKQGQLCPLTVSWDEKKYSKPLFNETVNW